MTLSKQLDKLTYVLWTEVYLFIGQLDGKSDDHIDIVDYFFSKRRRDVAEIHVFAILVSNFVKISVFSA